MKKEGFGLSRTNKLLIFITFVSLAIFSYLIFSKKPRADIRTVEVLRADILDTVQASGIVSPYKKVDVGAQVTGQVVKLGVELGEFVKKGTFLARIDPAIAMNDLQAKQANLEQLMALFDAKNIDLGTAQKELRRQKKMLLEDATTMSDADNAEALVNRTTAELRGLRAQIKQAQIQIDSNKTLLSYTEITAPIDGSVIGISVQEGQTVNAVQTIPTLITVAQLNVMTVRARVPEADIIRIKRGQRVFFSPIGNSEAKYYGYVRTIQPLPERINNAVFYNVIFETENPQGNLWPDMTVSVSFIIAEKKKALVLPWAAIAGNGSTGRYFVKILGADGEVSQREVHTGVDDKLKIEIINGVKERERVLIENLDATP